MSNLQREASSPNNANFVHNSMEAQNDLAQGTNLELTNEYQTRGYQQEAVGNWLYESNNGSDDLDQRWNYQPEETLAEELYPMRIPHIDDIRIHDDNVERPTEGTNEVQSIRAMHGALIQGIAQLPEAARDAQERLYNFQSDLDFINFWQDVRVWAYYLGLESWQARQHYRVVGGDAEMPSPLTPVLLGLRRRTRCLLETRQLRDQILRHNQPRVLNNDMRGRALRKLAEAMLSCEYAGWVPPFDGAALYGGADPTYELHRQERLLGYLRGTLPRSRDELEEEGAAFKAFEHSLRDAPQALRPRRAFTRLAPHCTGLYNAIHVFKHLAHKLDQLMEPREARRVKLFQCCNYARVSNIASTRVRIAERELYRMMQPVVEGQVRRIMRENGLNNLDEQDLEVRQTRIRLEGRATFVFEQYKPALEALVDDFGQRPGQPLRNRGLVVAHLERRMVTLIGGTSTAGASRARGDEGFEQGMRIALSHLSMKPMGVP